MPENLKNLLEEVDNLFEKEPTTNQRAWGLINQFYHLILTYMDKKSITRTQLAEDLGKSRSYISQMFNKTPNISIKKMVEIADAVGINLEINCKELAPDDIQIQIIEVPQNFAQFRPSVWTPPESSKGFNVEVQGRYSTNTDAFANSLN
jgi:transcriptional regulator with XRE-family HTH domain